MATDASANAVGKGSLCRSQVRSIDRLNANVVVYSKAQRAMRGKGVEM